MAHPDTDDGFREIQLNGKQLVFLFMSATVVSVVIFLLGVFVGRGARTENGSVADVAALEAPLADAVPASATEAPAAVPSGSDPTEAAPPATVDDLSYFNRLEQPKQAPEKLTKETPRAVAAIAPRVAPAPPAPAPAARVPAPPVPVPAAPVPAAPVAAAANAPAVGSGYVVQVTALNVRSEADAIAKRLTAKGYAAYVQSPANGTPAVYRVRVGTFNTKREADTMAAKLQKEEQFKPWVTR